MALTPDTLVQFIKGVGESRAKVLQAAGLDTVRDLLYFFPFRYEDRRHPTRIAEIGRNIDQSVLLRGRVVSAALRTSPVKRMKIFEAMFDDGTGTVMLVWFNQPYLADQIKRGDHLAIYGPPRLSSHGRLQIESPDWEKIEENEEGEGKIVPIYSKVGNIPPKALRRIVSNALESVDTLDDRLPSPIRERLGVIGLAESIREIHQPEELTPAFLRYRSPAHLRVILEEFFTFQLVMRVRRAADEVKKKSRAITIDDDLRAEVKRILPFKLTGAQKRVLKEIADDLRSDRPMYRLLQGDVGSGKTIVALIAAIIMIRNGHQVALLAPTEILVEQHYQRIRQLVDHSLVVAKATGSMTAGERRTLLAGLRDGYIQLVIGTHALLEEKVTFQSLGLAIVDEQHRFGVEQRQRLFAKGEMPDILVMTATPIPRSLALAIFGDLELSVIDELPPGRQRIKTAMRSSSDIERVYKFIDDEIDAGAQIYVVYPLIEESEKLNLKPLSEGFESIQRRFPKGRVAMMHGRLSTAEKEETMAKFKRGEIDILVATTVIEVGIDVPNASIMLILEADRFGLSQLHQLRGRVGRGERKSYCILVRNPRAAEDSLERLKIFEATRDGFEVAERDLHLRGPGEFLGTRQSGVPRFRFGNILRDHDLMEQARDAAIELMEKEGAARGEEIAREMLGVAVEATRDEVTGHRSQVAGAFATLPRPSRLPLRPATRDLRPFMDEYVLSGLRPTGRVHLGNYFGAIRNWVRLQDSYRCYFFIADWHALTSDYADPSNIRQSTFDAVADWLAAGLDPKKSTLFLQSAIKQHAELHLLLSMVTPLPWLERVPTFKDQQAQIEDKDLNTYGFLGYPLLQTADIIIYRANYVPVGEDQASHLELSREIVRRFNNFYGEVFPEPQPLFTATPKVPGLDGRKMSKSYNNTIGLTASADEIRTLAMTMFTDPNRIRRKDPGNPDICNLFQFHRLFSDEATIARVDHECRTAQIGCVDDKRLIAEIMIEKLRPIRERREEIDRDPQIVWDVLREGNEHARERAEETMKLVRGAMKIEYPELR